MVQALKKGQKVDLTKGKSLNDVIVCVGWKTNDPNVEIDMAAVMLNEDGKCKRDENFIFYGNPQDLSGSVRILEKGQIKINFNTIPGEINNITFTLTIYDAIKRKLTFNNVSNIYCSIKNSNGDSLLRYDLMDKWNGENAIVVADIYRYKGEWKFNPIGMGYDGGLESLCRSFGIDVKNEEIDVHTKKVELPDPEPPLPIHKVELKKIELKKKGDKISLEKKPKEALGKITINLNWNRGNNRSAFSLFSKPKSIDLDLGCFVETKLGHKFCIQALGGYFGDYDNYPYVLLDGDDRTGNVSTGENIHINGNNIKYIKKILVYTFIYSGVVNWTETDGVVTIKQIGGPDIEVKLDERNANNNMCAIAALNNVNDETLSIERLVQYFNGHRDMDKTFGWGFTWKTGSK